MGRRRGAIPAGQVCGGSPESGQRGGGIHAVRVGPASMHRDELCAAGNEDISGYASTRVLVRALADLHACPCCCFHYSPAVWGSHRANETVAFLAFLLHV